MTKVLSVGAGNLHSLAVRADGSLWGFGSNASYQLTNGVTSSTEWAQPIPGISGAVSATGGTGHSLAVPASHELFGWGLNTSGQVGIGTTQSPQQTPVSLSASNLAWRVAKPVMNPIGGIFTTTEPSVAITTSTSGATIRYTTNGVDPTASDTIVSGNISVTQSLTLKARAFKSGMADSVVASEVYTLNAALPTFNPLQGTYNTNQNVTISSASRSDHPLHDRWNNESDGELCRLQRSRRRHPDDDAESGGLPDGLDYEQRRDLDLHDEGRDPLDQSKRRKFSRALRM